MNIIEKYNKLISNNPPIDNYASIYNFLVNESNKMFFNKRAHEFLEIIPDLIKRTTYSNIDWIQIAKIRNIDGFLNVMKKVIMETDIYKSGITYSDILRRLLFEDVYDEEFTNYLTSIKLHPKDVLAIAKDISYGKNSLVWVYFLDKIINNKIVEIDANEVFTLAVELYTVSYINKYMLIDKNLDYFLNNMDLWRLYEYTVSDQELHAKIKNYIFNNLNTLLPRIKAKNLISVLKTCENKEQYDIVLKYMLDNFGKIVDDYSPCNAISYLYNDVKDYPELENKRREYVKDNFGEIVKDIYYTANDKDVIKQNDGEKQERQRLAIIDIIKLIFEEISRNENVGYDDIIEIGSGAYVHVYKVGDKVVKIGSKRQNQYITNNPYILAPLLRKTLKVDSGFEYEGIFVEITEYVDIIEDEITKADLYRLYSKMRDIGLEWVDIDARNVGRLRKDNKIYWNSNLDPSDSSLDMNEKIRPDIMLKKGDLVIVDTDFIYREGEVPRDLNTHVLEIWREYHDRYNYEKYRDREGKRRK